MQKPAALRRTALLSTIAIASLAALLLSGCAPETAKPSKTSTPDVAAPLFASDEEALAAAEGAYAKYQAAFDVVSASGGVDVSGLDAVAHGAALERALESAQQFADNQVHTVGATSFVTYKPQSLSYGPGATAKLVLYICDDLTDSIPMDPNGNALATRTGSSQYPFAITISDVEDKGLVLTTKDLWNGTNYCEI